MGASHHIESQRSSYRPMPLAAQLKLRRAVSLNGREPTGWLLGSQVPTIDTAMSGGLMAARTVSRLVELIEIAYPPMRCVGCAVELSSVNPPDADANFHRPKCVRCVRGAS